MLCIKKYFNDLSWSGRNEFIETSGRLHPLWPQGKRLGTPRTTDNNNNNNNIYLLQLGCYPVAVVILYVNKTWNWLLLDLSWEGYMRSM